jgi:hydroxymethylpyrimidine/phosphomethylpyrimidine kinase
LIKTTSSAMKTVLTIAGSDASGGAGIQADIKTITAHKMYAMSAITALTAQNTLGVSGILRTPPDFIQQQIDCIFNDIRPDAIKIGMVGDAGAIAAIAGALRCHAAKNIVLDPVMIATSGCRLLASEAVAALQKDLLPLAAVITPNLPEAEVLSGLKIDSRADMLTAARQLAGRFPGGILIKGGHLPDTADDLLFWQKVPYWFPGTKIPTANTHGTGCTLSSAIACGLAAGMALPVAVRQAKTYLTGALADGLALGHGNGPLNHMYNL